MPALIDQKAERPSIVITGHDQYLFREGTHSRLYEKLGAHYVGDAIHFAVWAPNDESVSVNGAYDGCAPRSSPRRSAGDSGIWQARVPQAKPGSVYKFHI